MNIDRLSEENVRIDWNVECEQAQLIATLHHTVLLYYTQKEISAVSVLLSSKWKKKGKIL